MSEEQLKRLVKGKIKLKTHNGMHIMQLDTCAVHIKFKHVKKRCVFFVGSRKWTGIARDARHSSTQYN